MEWWQWLGIILFFGVFCFVVRSINEAGNRSPWQVCLGAGAIAALIGVVVGFGFWGLVSLWEWLPEERHWMFGVTVGLFFGIFGFLAGERLSESRWAPYVSAAVAFFIATEIGVLIYRICIFL